jgi:hypothetical protein
MWCLGWFGRLRKLALAPDECADLLTYPHGRLYGTSGYAGICLELTVPGTCPE